MTEKVEQDENEAESGEGASISPDFAFYSGILEESSVQAFLDMAYQRSDRAPCVIFFLTTYGGDPHAAYRLIRGLRRAYRYVTLAIMGPCKSAGTLAALGANELVFGIHGELGPLDMQVLRPDEIAVHDSGLEVTTALSALTALSFQVFESHLLQIISKSSSSVSMRTASHIAAEVTVGLLSPIASQIDPHRLGKIQRAVAIAWSYGNRLSKAGGNVRPGGIARLVNGYPDHSFVIDVDEAATLFLNVGQFNAESYTQICGSNPSLIEPEDPQPKYGFIEDMRMQFGGDSADEGVNDDGKEGGHHAAHDRDSAGDPQPAEGQGGGTDADPGPVSAEPDGRGAVGGSVPGAPGSGDAAKRSTPNRNPK